jgi:hypothetical protein
MRAVNDGGAMNLKKVLAKTAIILYAILVSFTCLSCTWYEAEMFDGLKKAKVPIYLPGLEPTISTQEYKIALNLGIASSYALACICNEDQAALPRYIGMIYDYAKILGTPETILSKLGGITAAMNRGDWEKVGDLSGKFGEEVLKALGKLGKKDDVILAVAASELEGLYITAKSVDHQFSPESAKLLRNPRFVKDQEGLLKDLSEGLKAKKEVKAIMAALPKIDQIINRPESYTYTQADVKELISICEPLRQTLLSD